MSKYFTLALLCAIMALLPGCSKDDNNSSPSNGSSSSYKMSATIIRQADTTLFSASGISWVMAVDSNFVCRIVGSGSLADGANAKLTFIIRPYNSAAAAVYDSVYVFDSTYYSGGGSYADYETGDPVYAETNFAQCTLKFTKIKPGTMSGTFSGRLTDGSVVANGIFIALLRTY